jgi:hypothetical protein
MGRTSELVPWAIYLSVCLSICLPICLSSLYLYISSTYHLSSYHLSIYIIYQSIIYMSIYPVYLYLSIYLSIDHLSAHQSIFNYLSTYHLFTYHLSIHPPITYQLMQYSKKEDVCICINMYVHLFSCMHRYMSAYMHVHIFSCVQVHECFCACAHIDI